MIEAERFYVELGRSIRERREQLELTQADLAKLLNLSRTSVTNIERGRQRLLIDQFCRVAEILNCSHEALLTVALRHSQTRSTLSADLTSMPTVARFVNTTLHRKTKESQS